MKRCLSHCQEKVLNSLSVTEWWICPITICVYVHGGLEAPYKSLDTLQDFVPSDFGVNAIRLWTPAHLLLCDFI